MALLWKEHSCLLHLQALPVIRGGLDLPKGVAELPFPGNFFHWRPFKDIFHPLVEKCFVSLWRTSEMHNDEVRKKIQWACYYDGCWKFMRPTLYQQNKPSCLLSACKKNILYKKKRNHQTTEETQEILHSLIAKVWELLSWSSHCILHASIFFSQH